MAAHCRTPTAWATACRPVTCAEFAEAMYRAGQTRREVRGRLAAMGRWSAVTVESEAYGAAQRLGLRFGYGGGVLVARPRSDGTRALARDALRGCPEEVRRRYRSLRRYGVGTREALRALGL